MKESCFSICTDRGNNKNLKKVNAVTVRTFDIYQYKVVAKVLDMCVNKTLIAAAIFVSIDNAFQVNKIPWEKGLCLGEDNASVNLEKI